MRKAFSRFRSGERGVAMVETALIVIPLFAFIFLLMDVAWVIFAQSTLQEAVREGVRFAVTGQGSATAFDGSVRDYIRAHSMGLITATNEATVIKISYYSAGTLAPVTGPAAASAGNIIEISVNGLSVNSFGPIMRAATPWTLSAIASDIMEHAPAAGG